MKVAKTKKEANKKHAKLTKKPLRTRTEKKRNATSRASVDPAKTKSSVDRKQKRQHKVQFFSSLFFSF